MGPGEVLPSFLRNTSQRKRPADLPAGLFPAGLHCRYFLYQYVRFSAPVTLLGGVQFCRAALPVHVLGVLGGVPPRPPPGGAARPQPMQNRSSVVVVVPSLLVVVTLTIPATGLGGRPPPDNTLLADRDVNGLTA